jgi:DNA processing protein
LFFRGVLPNPEKPLAAVVGTRSPSSAGAKQAYEFGRDFGESGISVVSGLARGIDAMAHKGAVRTSSPTIAVLGSGPDEVFPKSNRDLARRLVEAGGALVSEYPPGTPPLKHHFPARNRIISGLARAVVVVEAPEKSGALITADFALDQGRELWVGSAGLTSAMGWGCRKLASEGARIAPGANAVISDWGYGTPSKKSADNALDPRSFGIRCARELELELGFDTVPLQGGS